MDSTTKKLTNTTSTQQANYAYIIFAIATVYALSIFFVMILFGIKLRSINKKNKHISLNHHEIKVSKSVTNNNYYSNHADVGENMTSELKYKTPIVTKTSALNKTVATKTPASTSAVASSDTLTLPNSISSLILLFKQTDQGEEDRSEITVDLIKNYLFFKFNTNK